MEKLKQNGSENESRIWLKGRGWKEPVFGGAVLLPPIPRSSQVPPVDSQKSPHRCFLQDRVTGFGCNNFSSIASSARGWMWSGLVEPRHPPDRSQREPRDKLDPPGSPEGSPVAGCGNLVEVLSFHSPRRAPACSDRPGRGASDSSSSAMGCSDQLRSRCLPPACHRVAHPRLASH